RPSNCLRIERGSASAQSARCLAPRSFRRSPKQKSGAAPSRAAPFSFFGSSLAKGTLPMGYPILRTSTTDKPAQAGWPVYGAYTIKPKRHRRTKGAIASIRGTIKTILEESHPQTCRQIFYAATVRGAVAKLEAEYQKTIIRLLVKLREKGEIPFEWISD